MGEDADQIQRVVRRRDFAFAERLPFDEALDGFQQGEDADFISYLYDFANATPDRQTDGFIKFTRFAVHFSPYGIWDYIGHATGFFPVAV
ncbi:hypothetical protein IT763_17170 [Serratia sp. CMO1]|uniref:hypothetical protein n=1 Tax=Serratia sp. CMO1 TaxID=2785630 RepID=UPI0018DAD812|nr:hypothetical protein [Serratia sp. CMO1]QPI31202.1 hypothetical protein IT763_17170 [Serratia sp. CMO1]